MPTSQVAPPTVSPKEALILQLLVDDGELYGLELVTRSKRQLKRGTVYVTLGRMEDKGFITSRLEAPPRQSGGLPRRLYKPTAIGRRMLAVWREMSRLVRQLTPRLAR